MFYQPFYLIIAKKLWMTAPRSSGGESGGGKAARGSSPAGRLRLCGWNGEFQALPARTAVGRAAVTLAWFKAAWPQFDRRARARETARHQ